MAQPAPPTNPFDSFSPVAQQQPPPQQRQQQQPPNQWGQPPPVGTANPFVSLNNGASANPFVAAPVQGQGVMAQQAAPMAAQPQRQMSLGGYPAQPQVQTQQQYQQQLVPHSAPVQSPWALQPLQPQQPVQQPPQPVGAGAIVPVAPPARGQAYDPFGVFGAASPAPPQQQQPVQQSPFDAAPQQQQVQLHQTQQNPYAQLPPALTPTPQEKLQQEMQHFNLRGEHNTSLLPDEEEDEALALIDVELDDDSTGEDLEERKRDGEFLSSNRDSAGPKDSKGSRGSPPGRRKNSWDRNPDLAPPPPVTPGRRHSEYLAEHSAPAISSPLPRHELVHHSGYVLSRISFRTVLMRKWKQTFWIQYGPTQLLFFRTFADYEDWLNNPYHTMKAREFLVKLRVDFVSDLKKASVMGYQVTQVRRKPYGRNVMLHFKLERWMDYGPTIAAAFAAREDEMMNSPTHRRNGGGDGDGGMNTVNDVSALRKIILGCMRNARDAASAAVAAARGAGPSDLAAPVAMRGRYDAEHSREARVPTSSGNMGYHQAFSAEAGERRRSPPSPGRDRERRQTKADRTVPRSDLRVGDSPGGAAARVSARNMGYHQTFGAERSERRTMPAEQDLSDVGTEESQDEIEERNVAAPAPVIDLLG